MQFKSTLAVALALVAVAQACGSCGGCGGCGCQCLPPPSPYEAMCVAMSMPGPCVPQPCIPSCPEPCCVIRKCGPPPSPIQIHQAPPVTVAGPCTPVIEMPTPCLPPPMVIAHRAVVSKAVMKPQVYQRVIHVPITARFMKKCVGNVVENICYTARPKCCGPESPVPMVCAPKCCGCGC